MIERVMIGAGRAVKREVHELVKSAAMTRSQKANDPVFPPKA
jgi:Holliday junction resolvasome RuvABC endonuclease subunit